MIRHRPWWVVGIVAGALGPIGIAVHADSSDNHIQHARPNGQPGSPASAGRLFGSSSGMIRRGGGDPSGAPFSASRSGAFSGPRLAGPRPGPFAGPSFARPPFTGPSFAAPGAAPWTRTPAVGRPDAMGGSAQGGGALGGSTPAFSTRSGFGVSDGRLRPITPPIAATVGSPPQRTGVFTGRRPGGMASPGEMPSSFPGLLRNRGTVGGQPRMRPPSPTAPPSSPSALNRNVTPYSQDRPGFTRANPAAGRPGGPFPGYGPRGGGTTIVPGGITPVGRALGTLRPVDREGRTNVGRALGNLTPAPNFRGVRFRHRHAPLFAYDPFSGRYRPYRGRAGRIGVLLGTAATRPIYRYHFRQSYSLFYYPYYSPYVNPFDFGYSAFPSPYFYYNYGPQYIPSTRVVVVTQPVVVDQGGDAQSYSEDEGQGDLSGEDGAPADDTGSYYLNQGVEQDLASAMDDVKRAWTLGDIDLLLRHVRSDADVRVYLKGKYIYSLPSEDYRDLTHDAMENSHTVSFRWVTTDRRSSDEAYVEAEHTFTDRDGDRHTVYATYTLARIHGAWWISDVGSSNRQSDPVDKADAPDPSDKADASDNASPDDKADKADAPAKNGRQDSGDEPDAVGKSNPGGQTDRAHPSDPTDSGGDADPDDRGD